MIPRRFLPAFMLAACAPRVPLPDAPIVGGSPEARREVREALLAFDEWIGPGRLSIAAVEFSELPAGWAGVVRHPTYRVQLAEDLPVTEIGLVLRHELCHALDFSEGLLDDPPPRFTDPWVRAVERDRARLDVPSRADRHVWSEVLAQACEPGPYVAHALREPCPDDPPDAALLADWVLDRVYRAAAPLPSVPAPVGPDVTWAPGSGPIVHVEISASTDPASFVNIFGPNDQDIRDVALNVRTGEESDPLALPVGGDRSPTPEAPVGWDVPNYGMDGIAGFAGGPGALIPRAELPFGLDPSAPRVLWTDGTTWHVVEEECDSSRRIAFAADGDVWLARVLTSDSGDNTFAWRPAADPTR